MATEIKVPIPDQVTKEVRIVKWHKAEGQEVKKGELILEVETDKSVIEIEAPADGVVLQRLVRENDSIAVGEVVGSIGGAGEKAASAAGGASVAAVTEAEEVQEGKLRVSPLAKNLAAKLGVDLTTIAGSGPNGRIVKEDVERAAQNRPVTQAAAVADGRVMASPNAKRIAKEMGVDVSTVSSGSGAGGRIIGADVVAQGKPAVAGKAPSAKLLIGSAPAEGQPQPGTEVPVSKMRKAIAVNLQKSKQQAPHFTVTISIDMQRAMAFREDYNRGKEKADKLSVNDLVLKACAQSLRQYPAVNSRYTDEKITYMPDVNIGVATAIPDGLVVPVIVKADQLSWAQLGAESKRIVGEARKGKIAGMGKGTFTVTNLGMFGIDEFTAIVNPPESAILAVGGLKDQVVAINGMIAIRPILKVTLCSDHRIIDGALAAQFAAAMKVYLEEQID